MAGMTHGAWCHIEIPTANKDASKQFYGGVFGWKFTEVPEMKYTIYSTGDGEVGGGLFDPPAGIPRQITNYLLVQDLEASAARVGELGGKVCSDRMEVPGMGWFRVIADPDGNSLAMWQAAMTKPAPAAAKPKKAAPQAKKKTAKKPAKSAKKRR